MPLPETIAYHEAGHMAALNNATGLLGQVRVVVDSQGSWHFPHVAPLRNTPKLSDDDMQRAMIAWALGGKLAVKEAMARGELPETVDFEEGYSGGGGSDESIVLAALSHLQNEELDIQTKRVERLFENDDHWADVRNLANLVLERVELTEPNDDGNKIVELYDGDVSNNTNLNLKFEMIEC